MGLGGLWHGANWTFVLWGLLQGLGITFSHLTRKLRLPFTPPRWVLTVVTFHFITVLWVFFRAPDLSAVARVITGPFVSPVGDLAGFASTHRFELILLLVFLASHRLDDHRRLRCSPAKRPAVVAWACIAILWTLALTISGNQSAAFIYFDF